MSDPLDGIDEPSRPWRRRALALALLVAAVFAGLRFVRVDADLPRGITPSFSLFTDEGIYARNAFNLANNRPWRVPTDYNTAINYPAFSAPQAIVFKAFGANIAVARSLNAVYSIVLIGLIAALLWRRVSPLAACAAAALALSNYILFFFSRFAHLDVPMAMWLALALLLAFGNRRPVSVLRGGAIGVALALAVLTKTNALFAAPMLLWAVWRQSREALPAPAAAGAAAGAPAGTPSSASSSARRWWAPMLAMCATCAVILIAYAVFIVAPLIDDYRIVASSVISDRLRLDPATLAFGVWRMFAGGSRIDLALYPLGLLAGIVVIWRDVRLRPIATALLLWIVLYAGMMGTQGGARPTRYYLPMIVPLMALVAVGVEHALRRRERVFLALAVAAIVASTSWNSYKIGRDLSQARYTFRDAARAIRAQIERDPAPQPLLLGHVSGNLSLFNGVPSVGAHFGRETERWQAFDLARYRPTHFVVYGPIGDLQQRLLTEGGYAWNLLAQYDVMSNYYRGGDGLYLYRLEAGNKPAAP